MPRDAKLFREMSVPFESQDSICNACEAFAKDVQEARKRHKITNVYCIYSSSYIDGEEECEGVNRISLGDTSKALPLVAWAFGMEQAEYEDLVRRLAGKRKPRND